MKLYVYSSDSLALVEVRWAFARFAAGRILLGAVFLFGVLKLHQSVSDTIGAHTTNVLASENEILRHQIFLIAPRVDRLEAQADQLRDRSTELRKLLDSRKPGRGAVGRTPNNNLRLKLQSSIAEARSPSP